MAEGTIGGTPISELPPSSFAYCEPGEEAVSTRCHFPIRDKSGKADAPHVRNALARLTGSEFEAKARPKVEAAAKELGIGSEGKATELKAEPMNTGKLERWLRGLIPRRILVAPFYGPLKAGLFGWPEDGKGRDLQGEYFHPETDFYGPYPQLRSTRQRAVDWHHTTFASGSHRDPIKDTMKAAIIGHLVLDDATEDDGLWADFWANAGEQRRKLIADLEMRGEQLYGSTQPIQSGIAKADFGRINVWPIQYHTISTSPVNLAAVVPPLKAALTEPIPDEIPAEALKALLLGLADNLADLRPTFPSEAADTFLDGAASDAAKAGRVLSAKNEAELRTLLDSLAAVVARMRDGPPPAEVLPNE
jgi:hypothetical protein